MTQESRRRLCSEHETCNQMTPPAVGRPQRTSDGTGCALVRSVGWLAGWLQPLHDDLQRRIIHHARIQGVLQQSQGGPALRLFTTGARLGQSELLAKSA